MIPARTWRSVLLPAPFGPMTASDSPRLHVQLEVTERPELLDLAPPEHLADRAADGRLLREAQVVADAEVGRADGVRLAGPVDAELRWAAQELHQMTLAKLGSRRLKTIVDRARKTRLATSRIASSSMFGGPLGFPPGIGVP